MEKFLVFLACALAATQASTGMHDVVTKTLVCYLHLDTTSLLLLTEMHRWEQHRFCFSGDCFCYIQ